jgi:hypothetical protein
MIQFSSSMLACQRPVVVGPVCMYLTRQRTSLVDEFTNRLSVPVAVTVTVWLDVVAARVSTISYAFVVKLYNSID